MNDRLDLSIETLVNRGKVLNSTLFFDRCYEFGYVLNHSLLNYTPEIFLIGPIFIVNVNNNILPILQALDRIPPHHLLVVNNTQPGNSALLGDIIMTAAKQHQVQGLFVLGNVRDIAQAPVIGIPLWAEGTVLTAAPMGEACKQFPKSLEIGDRRLQEGDWLIGDRDGLLTISADRFRFVLKAAEIKQRKELAFINKLKEGQTMAELIGLHTHLEGKGPLTIDF